jgi:hypothetical protein
MASIMHTLLMIIAIHDALPAQLATQFLLLLWVLRAPPSFNNPKHETATIDSTIIAHIALSRVMEDTMDNTIDSSL